MKSSRASNFSQSYDYSSRQLTSLFIPITTAIVLLEVVIRNGSGGSSSNIHIVILKIRSCCGHC